MKNIKPIVEETAISVLTGELVRLRRASDGSPICPVCGLIWYPESEHAWDKDGTTEAGLTLVSPTWSICSCCGIEFGEEDIPYTGETLESAWARLRERWLQQTGWSDAALKQVRDNLGLDV